MSTYSPEIEQQLREAGISEEMIQAQKQMLKMGSGHLHIDRPATPGDGILVLDQHQQDVFTALFEATAPEWKIHRFVPASGAASRMFKHLQAPNALEDPMVQELLENVAGSGIGEDVPAATIQGSKEELLRFLLDDLQLANLPKALIKFHAYPEGSRTALEEQFEEASQLLGDLQENIHMHFTVSPEHMDAFRQQCERLAKKFGDERELNYILEYSEQAQATQTIATDEDGQEVIENGKLVLRPGGHGALIHNLYALVTDIAFIKNIDNVALKNKIESSIQWKKILGGKLFDLRIKVFQYLLELEEGRISPSLPKFLKEEFSSECPEDPKEIFDLLNRPIRVCGMVPNTGEPGGGPYWVKDRNGNIRLQIVEKSEIDLSDSTNVDLMNASTHFNPVDIVCSLRNYKGRKFRLLDFVNQSAFFTAEKSHRGKNITALELPGLWNGAMSDWLTRFVEVPQGTFNPVKTVNDLLKPNHQT